MFFFFFKQKTAYEIRPCDWSSDVCSSDLVDRDRRFLVMASPKRDLVGLERGRGRRLLEDVRLGERARLARGLGERRLNRGGRRAVGASGGDERQRQGNQGTVHERPTRRRRNSRNDAPLHRRTTSPGTSWQTPYRCRWPSPGTPGSSCHR